MDSESSILCDDILITNLACPLHKEVECPLREAKPFDGINSYLTIKHGKDYFEVGSF
jgi:hypothetical protein